MLDKALSIFLITVLAVGTVQAVLPTIGHAMSSLTGSLNTPASKS